MTHLPPTGLLKTRARKFAILEVRRGGRSTAPPIHTPLLRVRMRKSFHVLRPIDYRLFSIMIRDQSI